jgi:glycine/D-amino acid oxidase-like deaminating enzyme
MESLWSDISLPQYPALQGDVKTDVLVVGGGMAGLLCAYQLQKVGVSVVVAEARRICGGVTANTTAKVTSQQGLIYHKLLQTLGKERAQMYLQVNQAAISQYRMLSAQIPCHWEDKANYVYSESDRQALEEEASALHRLGFPATLQSRVALPFPAAGAVEFRRQGQFHPLEFAAGIAGDLTIYENTPVLSIKGSIGRCEHGTITAKKVIVATHFPFINTHGSYFLKLYQQRSYVLALENGPDVAGMYIGAEKNSLSFRNAGSALLLGGGGHRTGKKGGRLERAGGFCCNLLSGRIRFPALGHPGLHELGRHPLYRQLFHPDAGSVCGYRLQQMGHDLFHGGRHAFDGSNHQRQ